MPLLNPFGFATMCQFLGDLLKKFKKNAVNSNSSVPTNKNSEESLSFVRQVAESLSQCVSSSDEYLKSECPICFEEPKLEDAVHTPCAHMFCRMCIISEFEEQQNRIKKNVASVSMFKKTSSSGQPNSIDGGDCPVCHSYVKVSFFDLTSDMIL